MLSEGGHSPGLVSKILAVYFMKQRKEFFELSELTTVFQQPKPTEHIRYCAELWKGTAQETRQRGQWLARGPTLSLRYGSGSRWSLTWPGGAGTVLPPLLFHWQFQCFGALASWSWHTTFLWKVGVLGQHIRLEPLSQGPCTSLLLPCLGAQCHLLRVPQHRWLLSEKASSYL